MVPERAVDEAVEERLSSKVPKSHINFLSASVPLIERFKALSIT
jgi:hypothetical protein